MCVHVHLRLQIHLLVRSHLQPCSKRELCLRQRGWRAGLAYQSRARPYRRTLGQTRVKILLVSAGNQIIVVENHSSGNYGLIYANQQQLLRGKGASNREAHPLRLMNGADSISYWRDVFGNCSWGQRHCIQGAPLLSDSVCVCLCLWTTFIRIVSFIIDGSHIDQTFQFLGLWSILPLQYWINIWQTALFALSIYCSWEICGLLQLMYPGLTYYLEGEKVGKIKYLAFYCLLIN